MAKKGSQKTTNLKNEFFFNNKGVTYFGKEKSQGVICKIQAIPQSFKYFFSISQIVVLRPGPQKMATIR